MPSIHGDYGVTSIQKSKPDDTSIICITCINVILKSNGSDPECTGGMESVVNSEPDSQDMYWCA